MAKKKKRKKRNKASKKNMNRDLKRKKIQKKKSSVKDKSEKEKQNEDKKITAREEKKERKKIKNKKKVKFTDKEKKSRLVKKKENKRRRIKENKKKFLTFVFIIILILIAVFTLFGENDEKEQRNGNNNEVKNKKAEEKRQKEEKQKITLNLCREELDQSEFWKGKIEPMLLLYNEPGNLESEAVEISACKDRELEILEEKEIEGTNYQKVQIVEGILSGWQKKSVLFGKEKPEGKEKTRQELLEERFEAVSQSKIESVEFQDGILKIKIADYVDAASNDKEALRDAATDIAIVINDNIGKFPDFKETQIIGKQHIITLGYKESKVTTMKFLTEIGIKEVE